MEQKKKLYIYITIVVGIFLLIYYVLIPAMKPTTFEFDLKKGYAQLEQKYNEFYARPDIKYGENFDIALDSIENVITEEEANLVANFTLMGKTNKIYEYVQYKVIFGDQMVEGILTRNLDNDPMYNYLKTFGEKDFMELHTNQRVQNSIPYPYKSISDIGPWVLERKVPYKGEIEELYNIMNHGYVVINDQDLNILDIFPFQFEELTTVIAE